VRLRWLGAWQKVRAV